MDTPTASVPVKAIAAAIVVAVLVGVAFFSVQSGLAGSSTLVEGATSLDVTGTAAAAPQSQDGVDEVPEDATAADSAETTESGEAATTSNRETDEKDSTRGSSDNRNVADADPATSESDDTNSPDTDSLDTDSSDAAASDGTATPETTETPATEAGAAGADEATSATSDSAAGAPEVPAESPSSSGEAVAAEPACVDPQILLPDGTCGLAPVPGTLPPVSSCPAGTTSIDGDCVRDAPACPGGTTVNVAGDCVRDAPACPGGTTVNAAGDCVREAPVCPEGHIADIDGSCIDFGSTGVFCALPLIPGPDGGCVEGPDDESSCLDTPGCVVVDPAGCPLGTVAVGDDCLRPVCGVGTFWNGVECEEPLVECAPGEVLTDGICVAPDCGAYEYHDGTSCVPVITNCADGSVAVGEPCPPVVPESSCPAGSRRIGTGPCVAILVFEPLDTACPSGEVLIGGVCVHVAIDPGIEIGINPDLVPGLGGNPFDN